MRGVVFESRLLNQFDIVLTGSQYDAVSFFKHRSEGETNSTFAYAPADLRIAAYRQCREVLWALDAAWCKRPEMACVTSFLRYFGGPLHLMMRRYRFVEESMTIGREEDVNVVDQTRNHYKLWNRIDAKNLRAMETNDTDMQRYRRIIADSESLLFPKLGEFIETGGEGHCNTCMYRPSYGAENIHCFGGVKLCDDCESKWREYLLSFPERATKVFPELVATCERAVVNVQIPEVNP